MSKIPLLVIVGPTASGKTALAVECALRFNGEVVSADSMQIYKGMSIATAKPCEAEMRGVRHHLIDFLDVTENYSVADFTADAGKAVDGITARGKLPILVGGTGLYIDSFVNNIRFAEEKSDGEVRRRLEAEMEEAGAGKLLERLASIDPETAARLHENNRKRIIRALEVYELTGKTFSEQQTLSRREPSGFDACFVGISFRDRQKLYDRIDSRVDRMLEDGLLDEAAMYYRLSDRATSSQAIGYKELKPYFDGELTLDEAVANLKQATRRYAKRQLTWFRRNEKIKWFYYDDYESTAEFYEDVTEYVREVIR